MKRETKNQIILGMALAAAVLALTALSSGCDQQEIACRGAYYECRRWVERVHPDGGYYNPKDQAVIDCGNNYVACVETSTAP